MATFDLPNARLRVGLPITDTSKDDELTSAIDFALAVAEQYCDRRFAWKVETIRFYYTTTSAFETERKPISRLRSITLENGQPVSTNQYKVHYQNGIIMFDKALVNRQLEITYEGGFAPMPADLQIVLWGIFDVIWAQMQGGATVSAGEIDSITIPDVGTIRYSNSTSGAKSGSSADSIYGVNFNLLDKYRRIGA